MKLRDYQGGLKFGIYREWDAGADVVFAVQATRTGKTVVFSSVVSDSDEPAIIIAHRLELVAQTSLALAYSGVYHDVIASKKVVRQIHRLHLEKVGKTFVRPNGATCHVAAVKTLLSRQKKLARLFPTIKKWVVDEGHHVLKDNEWGKAVALFPNAKGLLVSATPTRADGRGLGRRADGVADSLVLGLQMREAIELGWLLDYKIYAPQGDYHRPEEIGQDGELKKSAVKESIRKSHIIGDAVAHYLRIIPGKKAVVYNSDVETAISTAEAFNAAGIPAAVVTSETDLAVREKILRKFAIGEILIICNVDLFGEGTDMPDLDAVVMMRPTESFALYCQQFNRASTISLPEGVPEDKAERLAAIARSAKPYAIIIDHVGNVIRHGLPDAPRVWTLDRREKRGRGGPAEGEIPVRACPQCTGVYERFYKACPFCGHVIVPTNRSGPEFVDGDLIELDAATLARMRGEIERVDMEPALYAAELAARHVPLIGQKAHVKRHVARQEAQTALRASIAWWAGYQRAVGRDDSESYRRFYLTFGVDVMTAQTLGREEALRLAERVNERLARGDK